MADKLISKKVKKQIDSRYWLIPPEIYNPLNKEFNFNFDPCPYPYQRDGIDIEWGTSNWVNPPFRTKDAMNGHGPTAFVRKAIEEHKKGKTCVIIAPVQSYVNLLLEAGAELRPVGRVKWISALTGKPDPSPSNNALFILHGKPQNNRSDSMSDNRDHHQIKIQTVREQIRLTERVIAGNKEKLIALNKELETLTCQT